MLRPVVFISSSTLDTPSSFLQNNSSHRNDVQNREDEGLEIRKFYEDTISTEFNSLFQRHISSSPRLLTSPKRKTQLSQERRTPKLKLSLSDFFRSAAENDVSKISAFISAGFDLDAEDMFGWTAQMCAAQRGSFEALRLLVLSGADYKKTNKKNQSAKDLVMLSPGNQVNQLSSTHANVLAYLTELEKYTSFHAMEAELSKDANDPSDAKPSQPFFCPTCGVTFHETTTTDHQTSILHQLNTGSQPTRTLYGLPESNIGFRMLKNAGWDSEKGLGVDQTGRKFPIATVFKRNRHGLGQSVKQAPRVTHYPHLMEGGMKKQRLDVCITRQEMNAKETTSRKQNIRLRRELNGL